MANLKRAFKLVECENGWIMTDYYNDGRHSRAWAAESLSNLIVVITDICSAEGEKDDDDSSK